MIGPRRRRGAVAAMTAVVLFPVLGFAGLAVDLTRLWLVSARLKTAVDAASLMAARTMTSATRDADTTSLFWANYNSNGRSMNYLGATVTQPTITQVSATQIRVTATASVGKTLFGIVNRSPTLLTETTLAEREGTGLEIALVIDHTSSMNASAPGYATKLAAAQEAARTMLGILYGTDDTKRNLWVSVVPFARTINIGTANTAMLDTTNMPAGWNSANWSGCVEARRNGEDITDIGPQTLQGRLRPYYWPSTYRQVGWFDNSLPSSVAQLAVNDAAWRTLTGAAAYDGESRCSSGNAYPAVSVTLRTSAFNNNTQTYNVRFCRGANDWRLPNGTLNTNLSTNTGNSNYNPMYDSLRDSGLSGPGMLPTSAAGPNMLCAVSPILPLTASRATITTAVNGIAAPPRSGGTTIVTGMQGAWYTLSPNWQNSWNGISSGGSMGTLPLAYNTRNMIKAVVLLTDGENNWQPSYQYNSQTVRDSVAGASWYTELMYNAYGRRTDYNNNTPGTDIAAANSSSQQELNAEARLEERFAAICTAMKAQGIRIYTVGFEVANTSNPTRFRSLLQACATSTAQYIEAPTAASLNAAFTEVANQLSSLRLVE